MAELRSGSTHPARGRRPEVRAMLRWIVQSWLRPGGSEARWEQAAGRGRASGQPVPAADQGPAGGNPQQRPGANTGQNR